MDDYKAFSDIDFKEMPENIKLLFEKTTDYSFYVDELGENLLFKCPNMGSLLDEKMHYYLMYTRFKQSLKHKKPVDEAGYERLTLDECVRMLTKFGRAIVALNNGLQKKRFPQIEQNELLEKERASIMTRLDKLGKIDNTLKKKIVDSLHPHPYP